MIPDSWREIAKLYQRFAVEADQLDFSEEAAEAQYRYETFGEGENPPVPHPWVDDLIRNWPANKHACSRSIADLYPQ